jgi:hypothetical protein
MGRVRAEQRCGGCRHRAPEAAVSSRSNTKLLDQLVRAGEKCVRHLQAERPGRLEIDYQPVLRRRLHRQVGRFRSLEDPVNLIGRDPVHVDRIGPLGDQAAGGDEVAEV